MKRDGKTDIKDERYNKIKASIDFKNYRDARKITCIGLCFLVAFTNIIILFILWSDKTLLTRLIIIYNAIIIGSYGAAILAFTIAIKRILACPEKYVFREVRLKEYAFRFRHAYFIVPLEVNGNMLYLETENYFGLGWKQPRLDDYKEKLVIIGYNSDTGKVLVIDKT